MLQSGILCELGCIETTNCGLKLLVSQGTHDYANSHMLFYAALIRQFKHWLCYCIKIICFIHMLTHYHIVCNLLHIFLYFIILLIIKISVYHNANKQIRYIEAVNYGNKGKVELHTVLCQKSLFGQMFVETRTLHQYVLLEHAVPDLVHTFHCYKNYHFLWDGFSVDIRV